MSLPRSHNWLVRLDPFIPRFSELSVISINGTNAFIKCCAIYFHKLRANINSIIKLLEMNPDVLYKSIFMHPNNCITVQVDDNDFSCQYHECQYGPHMEDIINSSLLNVDRWQKRNTNIWRYVEHPFRKLQKEFIKKGFFLVDESDHTKGYNFFIRLYCHDPQHRLQL